MQGSFPKTKTNNMQLKKNIATSESGFIFNPGTGDSYSANPIAAEILALLKDGIPASNIKSTILEKYDVGHAQLEKDWDDFCNQLKYANLLDN
jgi:hypothetical protein